MDGAKLLEIVEKANEEVHPAHQAYIDETMFGLGEVIVDGKLDFERIAALITEHLAGGE